MTTVLLEKIISGGQTGVDRAALDFAIAHHIPHGGWCPKGRLAELDQIIPEIYLLKETDSSEYSVRTKLNIRDSDGTLVIVPGFPMTTTNGTLLTIEEAKRMQKPLLVFDLVSKEKNVNLITEWMQHHHIKILNIAGPRESKSPGIYQLTIELLAKIKWHQRADNGK